MLFGDIGFGGKDVVKCMKKSSSLVPFFFGDMFFYVIFNKRLAMNVKTTIVFVAALFSAMVVCSCSGDASTNRSPEIANNEVLLQLDSLSPCATNDQLDSIENVDTLFIASKDGKT